MDAPKQPSRRSFLTYMAYAMGGIAVGASGLVMIDSMNPAADAWERGIVDVDFRRIKAGSIISVVWMARYTFIYHRTPEDIAEARAEDWRKLPDPQSDEERVQEGHDEWLVVSGICTFGDCPLMFGPYIIPRGKWGGWQCPCCGSSYDKSGRVRNGPAPKNLYIPHYTVEADGRLRIGGKPITAPSER